MAKKKQEDAPKGSPAWMATFSDLMNLLLCFFVLLFSMSTVDAQKFEMVVASLQNSFSILPSGGTTIGEGELISSGVSALEMFDDFFNSSSALPEGEYEPEDEVVETQKITTEQAEEVCAAIRACIAEIYDEATAEAIRIQYGGSVSAASAPELFAQANIDGGLVGGASLKEDFGKIVNYK